MTRRLMLALLVSLLICLTISVPETPHAEAQTVPPHRLYLPVVASSVPRVWCRRCCTTVLSRVRLTRVFNSTTRVITRSTCEDGRFAAAAAPHSFLQACPWRRGAPYGAAEKASAFQQSFGRLPDCEWGADTDPDVPNLQGTSLIFSNAGAALVLRRPDGTPSDVLVYKAASPPSEGGWHGESVRPYVPSPVFHEQGQILYRKLDEAGGLPVADTDTAIDWASDPGDVIGGRRVRYPGWSFDNFFRPAITTEPATSQVFVAPDHAFDALAAHLSAATNSITFEGYTFESAPLGIVARTTSQSRRSSHYAAGRRARGRRLGSATLGRACSSPRRACECTTCGRTATQVFTTAMPISTQRCGFWTTGWP